MNYKATEKRRLFSEQGEAWRSALEAAESAEAFEQLATGLGLKTETLDSFNGMSVPEPLLNSTLWQQIQYLPAGSVSPMIMAGSQGTFAFVAMKDAPQADPGDPAFVAFAGQRSSGLSEAMGWARLREITDASLTAVFGAEGDIIPQ